MAKRKKRENDETPQALEAPLSVFQKDMLIIGLIRDEECFLSADGRLSAKDFPRVDILYGLLWECTKAYHRKFCEMPSQDWLNVELEARVAQLPFDLTTAQYDRMNEIMAMAFTIEPTDVKRAENRDFLSRYLKESLMNQARENIFDKPAAPADLKTMLARLAEQATELDMINQTGIEQPFPTEDWRPKSIGKILTGVSFIDHFLNGGDVPGEVYGLMGPYGSCKTALAVQLSIARARYCYDQWRQAGKQGKLGLCYVFLYEGNMDEYRIRALAHTAQINKTRLEDGEDLSTGESLQPYEKMRYASQLSNGAKVLGEAERATQAIRLLNANWRLIDMTGSQPEHQYRGGGLAAEIRDIIAADLRENPNCYCAHVVVDYVGAAAERHINLHSLDHSELRHFVGRFPYYAGNLIAKRFKCPVWCIHQLAAAANARSSGARQHNTDAAEAKNYAENCDFSFQVGVPDSQNRAVFQCTKHRRAPPITEVIIRIDGAFATVYGTDGKFVLDATSRRIVEAADMRRVVSVDELRPLHPSTKKKKPRIDLRDPGS